VKPLIAQPAYFADRLDTRLVPLKSAIQLRDPTFLSVEAPDGTLCIDYRSVRSLSYASLVTPFSDSGDLTQRRLLTIGFMAEGGTGHNLVVQLDAKGQGEILKNLAWRTGLKVSTGPRY
jgi:hypothetical protein